MICACCSLLCSSDSPRELECPLRQSVLTRLSSRASKNVVSEPDAQEGIRDAIQLLAGAEHILITGRICSVQTARSAVRLAQKLGATIDCAENGALFRNIEAVQRSGANTISISEARDLSNTLIVIGDDRLLDAFPLLPESLCRGSSSPLYASVPQNVVLIGQWGESALGKWRAAGFHAWTVPCAIQSIPTALAQTTRMPMTSESELVKTILSSKYTTVVWSAAFLEMDHPDLWCENLWQWIANRNEEKTRCSGLVLSNFDGTFQQACTWLTGFPGRIRFDGEHTKYDLRRNDYRVWIQQYARESTKAKSLVICIDESASESPFALDLRALNTINISVQPRVTDVSTLSHSVSLRCAVAGIQTTCDMFRADQNILVRVDSPQTERESAPSRSAEFNPPAAWWLDRLWKAC